MHEIVQWVSRNLMLLIIFVVVGFMLSSVGDHDDDES